MHLWLHTFKLVQQNRIFILQIKKWLHLDTVYNLGGEM